MTFLFVWYTIFLLYLIKLILNAMRYLNKKYHQVILTRSKSGENSRKIRNDLIKTFGLKYRFEIPSLEVKENFNFKFLNFKLNFFIFFKSIAELIRYNNKRPNRVNAKNGNIVKFTEPVKNYIKLKCDLTDGKFFCLYGHEIFYYEIMKF